MQATLSSKPHPFFFITLFKKKKEKTSNSNQYLYIPLQKSTQKPEILSQNEISLEIVDCLGIRPGWGGIT